MIGYNTGRWGLSFVFGVRGSVFPKAFVIALPNAVAAILLHYLASQNPDGAGIWHLKGLSKVWSVYTSVLSFLIVFRNNQAYTRFWEGATQIRQVRGEWFNASNTLIAFCNQSEEYAEKVHEFQHSLIRLMSLLYCSALQQVCELDNDRLEILELNMISKDRLTFLQMSKDRCEVVMSWIQRLIFDAHRSQILDVAPPLITRPLTELSTGMIRLNNADKLQEIPFPFPYAQLIMCMLMVHWIATPLVAREVVNSVLVSALTSFFVTFVLWALAFITMEIDQPFGEDANDLPLHAMQKDFNESLVTLMHPLAQQAPDFGDEGDDPARPVVRKNLGKALADDFSGAHGHLSESDLGRLQKVACICAVAAPSLKHNKVVAKKSHTRQRKTWSGRPLHDSQEDNNAGGADAKLSSLLWGSAGGAGAGGGSDSGTAASAAGQESDSPVLLGRLSADPEVGGAQWGGQKRGGAEAAVRADEQCVTAI